MHKCEDGTDCRFIDRQESNPFAYNKHGMCLSCLNLGWPLIESFVSSTEEIECKCRTVLWIMMVVCLAFCDQIVYVVLECVLLSYSLNSKAAQGRTILIRILFFIIGNVWEGFVRRTSSQIHQIKSIVMAVMGVPINASGDRKGQSTGRNLLVRDAFGLHKMIVAVTRCGNVFGIDNMNGKVHWKRHLKELDQLVDAEPVKVVALRTARHFPHPIQYAIVGRNRYTGNGFIYQFNPITGSENSRLTLKYRIKQMAVLHESEESRFLRPLLMLDEQNEVHVLPEEFSSAGVGLYMYTVADSGILSGFHISAGGGTDKKSLKATPIWELNLSGPSNSQRVINVAAKSSIEHVHSQGRVLNDRSVLYKYINPNLVAVTTLGMHSVHKTVLNVYLVDMVSGAIIFSMSHKRAKEPFYMVHSENWIAYSYYNEKVRRTEISEHCI